MFPLFAILTKVINSAPRLYLEGKLLLNQLQIPPALYEIVRLLLFTCSNYFPIKCTDKINLQALNAVDFSFHQIAHSNLSLSK